MNHIDKLFSFSSEARVRYGDNDYTVLSQGDYVRCAVTGEPIAITNLKYWSVKRQEAYASAKASLARHLELNPALRQST